MTQELQLPPTAINTRAAWRPVLRPITALVIVAQLALVLQPLSALAQEKGKSNTSPLVQSQINRINLLNRDVEAGKAQKLKDQASPADKASGDLAHIEEITKTLHADLRARGLASPARQSKAPGAPDAALRLEGSQRNQQAAELKSLLSRHASAHAVSAPLQTSSRSWPSAGRR